MPSDYIIWNILTMSMFYVPYMTFYEFQEFFKFSNKMKVTQFFGF